MKQMRRYERLEKIGQGSFGKVYKVRDRKSKTNFVLKEIDLSVLSPKQIKEAENEVQILSLLDHPYILSYVDSFKCQGKYSLAK
jgi:NIMA (never in mitosis gene a)-related kinase